MFSLQVLLPTGHQPDVLLGQQLSAGPRRVLCRWRPRAVPLLWEWIGWSLWTHPVSLWIPALHSITSTLQQLQHAKFHLKRRSTFLWNLSKHEIAWHGADAVLAMWIPRQVSSLPSCPFVKTVAGWLGEEKLTLLQWRTESEAMSLHCDISKEHTQRTRATDTDIRHVSKRLLGDLGRQNSDSHWMSHLFHEFFFEILYRFYRFGGISLGAGPADLTRGCTSTIPLPIGRTVATWSRCRSRRFRLETVDPRIMKPVPHATSNEQLVADILSCYIG